MWFWGLATTDDELTGIAASLGSDVPFSLLGGTAKGTGRGEILTPVLTAATLHWVVALSEGELHQLSQERRLRVLTLAGREQPQNIFADKNMRIGG